MKTRLSIDGDRLRWRTPDDHPKALLGAAAVLIGLLTVVIGVMDLFTPPKYRMDAVVVAIGGALLALVGLCVILARRGVIVDRRQQVVTTWWGVLVPFHRRVHPLSAFQEVSVDRKVVRRKHSCIIYPVKLVGPEAAAKFGAPTDALRARQEAERLAKFAGLALRDASTGQVVVREAGTLDESLRARAWRTNTLSEVPPRPDVTRSRHTVEGQRIVFETPCRTFNLYTTVVLLRGAAASVIVGLTMVQVWARDPGGWTLRGKVISMAIALLPFLWTLLLAFDMTLRRQQVIATPEELRVETRGIFRRRSRSLPSDEIEELVVGRTEEDGHLPEEPVIIARSDTLSIPFGHGLPIEELRWMRAILARVLTAEKTA